MVLNLKSHDVFASRYQNAEIEVFRSELDDILGVLRELKRRGVHIPSVRERTL